MFTATMERRAVRWFVCFATAIGKGTSMNGAKARVNRPGISHGFSHPSHAKRFLGEILSNWHLSCRWCPHGESNPGDDAVLVYVGKHEYVTSDLCCWKMPPATFGYAP
jgi:hypothetical protein